MNAGVPGPGWWLAADGKWYPPVPQGPAAPPPVPGPPARPPGRSTSTNKAVLISLACVFGFCLLGGGCLAVVGAVSPPKAPTTTAPSAQPPRTTATTAPPTTRESIDTTTTSSPPSNPYSSDVVLASFKVAGLEAPNVHDTTSDECRSASCTKATSADLFVIREWPDPDKTTAFVAAAPEGPERPVPLGSLTTITFRSGDGAPAYDRIKYETVLATLTGTPAPTTVPTTEATTTAPPPTEPPTTPAPTAPPTTAAPPPPTTQPPVTSPPTTSAPAAAPYYANCAAAKAAGAAPLYRGQPGYRSGLDRDNDGIACE